MRARTSSPVHDFIGREVRMQVRIEDLVLRNQRTMASLVEQFRQSQDYSEKVLPDPEMAEAHRLTACELERYL